MRVFQHSDEVARARRAQARDEFAQHHKSNGVLPQIVPYKALEDELRMVRKHYRALEKELRGVRDELAEERKALHEVRGLEEMYQQRLVKRSSRSCSRSSVRRWAMMRRIRIRWRRCRRRCGS